MLARVDEGQVQVLLREHVAEIREQGRRDGIDLTRPTEVDDDVVDLVGVADDRPHDRLDGREEQVPLQLDHLRASARGGEGVELRRRAAPARRHRRDVVAPADRRPVRARRVEEVQREIAGHAPADLHAAGAVAVHVERRREHREAQLAGEHREHATRDAALRGHPDALDPGAGPVVHPAGRHDAEHAVDELGRERALAGHRVLAAVGEGRRHQGDVAAVDEHRALPEVAIEHAFDVGIQDAEAAEHVADRAVPVAGVVLGRVDGLVDLQRPARVARVGLQHAREALVRRRAGHERRRHDRAGVDHRVARLPAAGREADRVERVARRLHADLVRDGRAPAVGERQAVGERLGHRLDRERHAGVADLVEVTVGRREADPEGVRIGVGQRRDVVGDRAVAHARVLRVQALEVVLHGGPSHDGGQPSVTCRIASRCSCASS